MQLADIMMVSWVRGALRKSGFLTGFMLATLFSFAGQARSELPMQCELEPQCRGECASSPAFSMHLTFRSDRVLHAEGADFEFNLLAIEDAGSDVARHFTSPQADPMAGAVLLLTLTADGQALMTTHGFFPSLGAATHAGRCQAGKKREAEN